MDETIRGVRSECCVDGLRPSGVIPPQEAILRSELLTTVAHETIALYERVGFAGLSRPHQVVFLVWCFAGQVGNGGFAQFFFNSTGAYAQETVTALEEAGYPESARLLSAAIDLFPGRLVPKDLEARNAILMDLPESSEVAWTALDRDYFRSEERTVYEQLGAYWARTAV